MIQERSVSNNQISQDKLASITSHTYPLSGSSSDRRWMVLTLLLLGIALFLRTFLIELRPLHHDESVNFHFVRETISKGYYPYSHQNYHGPLYFYLLTGSVLAFGEGVLAFRAPSWFFGFLICVIPWLTLRRYLQWRDIFFVTLFLAFSSSGIFHSRYAIHEILLLFGSLLMACFAFRFFAERDVSAGGLAALSAALCFTVKETTLVVGFSLFLATLIVFGPRRLGEELWVLLRERCGWLLLSAIFVIFVYTGGFQWSGGLREFALAFSQWISRGVEDSGHFKPWHYYLSLIYSTEPALLFALPLPLLIFIQRFFFRGMASSEQIGGEAAQARLLLFFASWGVLSLIIHSAIPYKMPWIAIQWSGALAISTGLALSLLLSNRPKLTSWIVAFPLVVLQIVFGVRYNFWIPYGPENRFSYVHTARGMIDVVDIVRPLLEDKQTARMLVGVNGYWPLPYYLREFTGNRVAYAVTQTVQKHLQEYDILLIEKDLEPQIPKDPCLASTYYRLSDVEEAYLILNTCRLKKTGTQ